MDYVQNLINGICQQTTGQIDSFITTVMRPVSVSYSTRKNNLSNKEPTELETENIPLADNNNPKFSTNMVNRLNTPFDHIERIVLQDLSNFMFKDGGNYFKNLFNFTTISGQEYGFSKIQMSEKDSDYSNVNYGAINNKLTSGPFFLDSFTYSPMIDYSVTGYNDTRHRPVVEDKRVGSFQDTFLTNYNTGWYDIPKNQIDRNRQKMTSTLFELGNLDKDIYDAKIGFRDSIRRIQRQDVIQNTDGKVYIETFCQHLATLFAKLSNIRMCHEVYGFKYPHEQWEGILALDIWYQMLYRAIDRQYPFDESNIGKNPMSRYKVQTKTDGDYIECEGKQIKIGGKFPNGSGLQWATTEPDEDGYVLVWSNKLYGGFNEVSEEISSRRTSCVTPRGVLCKIYQLVNNAEATINYEIHMPTGGWDDDPPGSGYLNPVPIGDRDFDWFHQRGNVYSDKDKSPFTKYPNLHLGRAYEVMSAADYCKKIKQVPGNPGTEYEKDLLGLTPEQQLSKKAKMIDFGYAALYDAFCVLRNEHVFNIFNSDANVNAIELFNLSHANYYSQA